MAILNFKQFSINERLGVAEASLMFSDVLESVTLSEFEKFLKSDEKKWDDKKIEIGWRKLKPEVGDFLLWASFPVVKFELLLKFNKMSPRRFETKYPEIKRRGSLSAIGGSASGFGHRNWKNYSKIVEPVRKIAEIGLIIQIGVEIDIDEVNFDFNSQKDKEEVIGGIGSTIFHEMNHSYENFSRVYGMRKEGKNLPIYRRQSPLSVTFSDLNKLRFPKEIYSFWSDEFLYLTYFGEKHELNANVQEMFYYLTRHPDKDFKDSRIWKMANKMASFDADEFYFGLLAKITERGDKDLGNFSLIGAESTEEVAERLKKMWVKVYKENIEEESTRPIAPFSTLEKMSCYEFLKFWESRLNKSGEYLKKKILKLSYELSQVDNFSQNI
jgi:hypothetical protein